MAESDLDAIRIEGLPDDVPAAMVAELVANVRAEVELERLRQSSPAYPLHVEPTGRKATVCVGVLESGPVYEETTRDGATPLVCPDCGRLLIGGSDPAVGFAFLACPAVPFGLPEEDRPCHAGCVVACGVPARKG